MEEKNMEFTDKMIEDIASYLVSEINDESQEDLIEKIDSFISDLSKKYMDERSYVRDLRALYNELKEIIPDNNAKATIFNLYFNNIDIIIDLRNNNKNNEKLKALKEKKKNFIDYEKQEKEEQREKTLKQKENVDISFYIEFIENVDNDEFLSILPNNKDKASLLIIDTILSYYLKEINTLKYLISISEDQEYINSLEKYLLIFNTILDYKNKLLSVNEEKQVIDNEIFYYMNGNISYIYNDILDYPEIYESIKVLIDSIKNGSFKNIKYFTNNGKTKGLVEVRDIRNNTRVLFDIVGYKKYCIIGAIVGKKETNSIYKERLISRYAKYKSDKENYLLEDIALTKILGGENNG